MATALAPTAVAHPALRCPKCAAEMVTYERSGIHVDQCRECRGIFLDRGELERLVDAESAAGWTGPQVPSAAAASTFPQAPVPAFPPGPHPRSEYRSEWYDDRAGWRHDDDDDDDDDRRYRRGKSGRPAKRRSLLGELLESIGD